MPEHHSLLRSPGTGEAPGPALVFTSSSLCWGPAASQGQEMYCLVRCSQLLYLTHAVISLVYKNVKIGISVQCYKGHYGALPLCLKTAHLSPSAACPRSVQLPCDGDSHVLHCWSCALFGGHG